MFKFNVPKNLFDEAAQQRLKQLYGAPDNKDELTGLAMISLAEGIAELTKDGYNSEEQTFFSQINSCFALSSPLPCGLFFSAWNSVMLRKSIDKISHCCKAKILLSNGMHFVELGKPIKIGAGKTYYYICKKCDRDCYAVDRNASKSDFKGGGEVFNENLGQGGGLAQKTDYNEDKAQGDNNGRAQVKKYTAEEKNKRYCVYCFHY